MKISATITVAVTPTNKIASACSAKPRALSCPSARSLFEKSGTNAELNAPSANSARNRLGKRKETKKASATQPVPMTAASSTSRTKPKTRLAAVSPPTVIKPR